MSISSRRLHLLRMPTTSNYSGLQGRPGRRTEEGVEVIDRHSGRLHQTRMPTSCDLGIYRSQWSHPSFRPVDPNMHLEQQHDNLTSPPKATQTDPTLTKNLYSLLHSITPFSERTQGYYIQKLRPISIIV